MKNRERTTWNDVNADKKELRAVAFLNFLGYEQN